MRETENLLRLLARRLGVVSLTSLVGLVGHVFGDGLFEAAAGHRVDAGAVVDERLGRLVERLGAVAAALVREGAHLLQTGQVADHQVALLAALLAATLLLHLLLLLLRWRRSWHRRRPPFFLLGRIQQQQVTALSL